MYSSIWLSVDSSPNIYDGLGLDAIYLITELIPRESNIVIAITIDNLNMLSSLDAVLQLIDKNISKDELKTIISKLMLNEDDNRKYVLNDVNIDTLGHKRLIKELNKYNR